MISKTGSKFVSCDKITEQYEVVQALHRFGTTSVYHSRNTIAGFKAVTVETKVSDKDLKQLEAAINQISKLSNEQVLQINHWSYEVETSSKKPTYHIWLIHDDFKENLLADVAAKIRRNESTSIGQLYHLMKHTTSLFADLQKGKLPYKPIKTSNFYSTQERFGKFDVTYVPTVNDLSGNSYEMDKDYLAPELKGKATAPGANPAADIFSLGLVLLEVGSLEAITGLNTSEKDMKKRISLTEKYFPKELIRVLYTMLSFDPSKRLSFAELYSKLNAMDSAKLGAHRVRIDTRDYEESKYDASRQLLIEAETVKYRQLHAFVPGTNDFYQFNLVNKEHVLAQKKTIESYSVPLESASISLSDGRIFIIGGDIEAVSNCCEFDSSTRLITEKKPMIERTRLIPSICAIGMTVYTCGGDSWANGVLSSFEKYDVHNDSWQSLSPLKKPASRFTLVPFNGVWIYKVGGISKNDKLFNSIERYNVAKDNWESVSLKADGLTASFRILQMSHAVQVNEREIFVFGGSNEDKPVNQSYSITVPNVGEEQITRLDTYTPRDRGLIGDKLIANQVISHAGEIFFLKYNKATIVCANFVPGSGWQDVKYAGV